MTKKVKYLTVDNNDDYIIFAGQYKSDSETINKYLTANKSDLVIYSVKLDGGKWVHTAIDMKDLTVHEIESSECKHGRIKFFNGGNSYKTDKTYLTRGYDIMDEIMAYHSDTLVSGKTIKGL